MRRLWIVRADLFNEPYASPAEAGVRQDDLDCAQGLRHFKGDGVGVDPITVTVPIHALIAHKDGKADDTARELVTAAQALFPGCTPDAVVEGSGVDAVCGEVATGLGEAGSSTR